jgi:hypothetical protein
MFQALMNFSQLLFSSTKRSLVAAEEVQVCAGTGRFNRPSPLLAKTKYRFCDRTTRCESTNMRNIPNVESTGVGQDTQRGEGNGRRKSSPARSETAAPGSRLSADEVLEAEAAEKLERR